MTVILILTFGAPGCAVASAYGKAPAWLSPLLLSIAFLLTLIPAK